MKISAWSSFYLLIVRYFKQTFIAWDLLSMAREKNLFVNNYEQKISIYTSTTGKKKITIHDQNFCNMGEWT